MRIPDNIKKIFKDIKIIELSSVLAGPLVGTYFVELGAEVIKIENKKNGGDVTRNWYLKEEKENGPSAYYRAANYGKKVIFLDFNEPEDKKRLYAIVKDADIVLNNIKLSSAARLGIHPDDIKKIKNEIIYAQLDGFDGEDAERAAYDIAMQAETGFLSMSGIENDNMKENDTSASANKLAKMPVALLDVIAAHQLKEAILVALIKKLKTGEGSYLRGSLYGAALTSLKNQATNYLLVNHIPRPMGTLHPNICPYGEILRFKDGMDIVLAIGNNTQFKNLLHILGLTNVIKSEEYKKNSQRLKGRDKLYRILQEAASDCEFSAIELKLKKMKVPYGKILTLKEVWEKENALKYIHDEYGVPIQSGIEYR